MIVHVPSESLVLKLKPSTAAAISSMMPARSLNYDGHNIAVRHTLDATKVLRNMGINAPSPIRYYYDWPRPPRFARVMDHQVTTAEFLTLHSKCFVFNEQGTSKTASAIWAADYLQRVGVIRRVLIVGKLSTLEPVWRQELFDVAIHRSAVTLHSSAEKRRQLLAQPVDYYIINHDGLKVIESELIARQDIDLVIVDEASAFRNGDTALYKTLKRIVAGKRLWLLTGTPCPNAPTDAWALARLVDPSRVPPYFNVFKRQTMNQLSQYKWVPKPGSEQIAFNAMQPAIRFKKSECLQLPPVTISYRQCQMSPAQTKAYSAMRNHFVAEASAGVQISAVNAADKIMKLRQIAAGAVKDPDTGVYHTLDHADRFKVLTEGIEEASAKVLIIVPFKGITYALEQEVNDWHKQRGDGRRCAVVNGDVSPNHRNRIFEDFRDDPTLTELVCHPKVMAHGLTLTQADMMIFYAPISSNEESAQVMDRINRNGQTRKMTIMRMYATDAEKSVYNTVEGKAVNQASIMDLYSKFLA